MEIITLKLLQNYRFGYQRPSEEEAFTTIEEGMEWLKEAFFNNKFYNDGFTAEIVQYKTEENSSLVMISKKYFNFSGEELKPETEVMSVEEPEYDYNFGPTFSRGDLVVFNKLVNLSNRTFQITIAVITGVPFTFSERKSKSMRTEDLDFTDQTYMIEYITDCGHLNHDHMLEEDLKPFDGQLPDELQALEYLSLHFRGEKQIDIKILQAIMNGEIYMLNRPKWQDFI